MAVDRKGLAMQRFIASTMPVDVKNNILAMLKLVSDCRHDVPLFANKMLGMDLNPFQEKFLKRTCTPRMKWAEVFGDMAEQIGGLLFGKNIGDPGNQSGKTVMIAIKHIHRNFYKIGLELDDVLIESADYGTLNLSPSSRQVRNCKNYIRQMLEEKFVIKVDGQKARMNKLHPALKGFLVGENVNLGQMRFRNRSVFSCVPTGHDQGASLAGGQYGYISYDECSQSHHLKDELGAKIMSRLISYGTGIDLVATTEVDSPSQQFYMRICKKGKRQEDGWWTCSGSFETNQFISEAQKTMVKNELRTTDPVRYRQVVYGEVVMAGGRFFDPMEIQQIVKLTNKITCIPGRKYLLVSDWGMADGGDDSVHMVLDYTDWVDGGKIKIVAHEEMNGGSPHMQFAIVQVLYDAYTYAMPGEEQETRPIYLMDAAALGGVTIKKLMKKLLPKGFDIEKSEALFILKKLLGEDRDFSHAEADGQLIEKNPDFGKIESYYIDKLSDQMSMYKIDDGKLQQDYVMTLMMGVAYIYRKIRRVGKPTTMNPLASYNANSRAITGRGRQNDVSTRQVGIAELIQN